MVSALRLPRPAWTEAPDFAFLRRGSDESDGDFVLLLCLSALRQVAMPPGYRSSWRATERCFWLDDAIAASLSVDR